MSQRTGLVVALVTCAACTDGSTRAEAASDSGTRLTDGSAAAADSAAPPSDSVPTSGADGGPAAADSSTPLADSGADPDASSTPIPTNPGFEGYGVLTLGAESSPTGYTTYHVTHLRDDGTEGSLRDALSASARHIVFDVGGTIVLDDELELEQDFITLDGTTAPSPGITITHRVGEYHGLIIKGTNRHTHDLILRGIRFDSVFEVDPVHVVGRAILSVDGDCKGADCDGGISNVIFDQLTHRDAVDKLTFWGKISDVTVSNCLFYRDEKALLFSFYGESYDLARRNISVHHNLFLENDERNPQVVGWTENLDFRNNAVFDYDFPESDGGYGMRIKSINSGRGTRNADANLINNVFATVGGNPGLALVYEDDTSPGCLAQGEVVSSDTGMGELWVAGNLLPAENCDQYSTVGAPRPVADYAAVTTQSADEVCAAVSVTAGVMYRTADESAAIDAMRANLGCDT